jgi:hypothetical protein
VILLTTAFDPERAPAPARLWTPVLAVSAVAAGVAGAGLLAGSLGGRPGQMAGALAAAAAHAGLFGIGWVLATGGRPGWPAPVCRIALMLAAAALSDRLSAWGALAYLGVPVALVAEVRGRPEMRRIGAIWCRPRDIAVGLAAGAFLGAHLLVSASLTFGYAARLGSAASYAAAAAYDLGVNALIAEWLFRGALFSMLWRRQPFWAAAGLSTGGALLRYLLDPNLPGTVEVRLGAVFYVGLLGVAACALRALTGSLLPGYAATAAFFGAYRLLSH